MRSRRTSAPAARPLIAAVAALVVLLTAGSAAAAPTWRLEQPAPPPGAPFKAALGPPGDLQFWAPNRGLLAVEGNSLYPRGIFVYDGATWRQLSVVCGGAADTTRIAWAGPTEFWTISAPSRPRIGNGTTLCRFKDGQVVASYGTLPSSPDPYQPMNAAVCAAPDDCWFGGPAATDPSGGRVGAFRLHWDGQTLTTSYGPQGRGISDMEAFDGSIWESTIVGPGPEQRTAPANRDQEIQPRLVHRLGGTEFTSDPFVPASQSGVPADGTELLALDGDAGSLWAAGGGAASGPSAPVDGAVPRPPIALRRGAGDAAFAEVPLSAPSGTFGLTDRFADVAAIPGSASAWMAVQSFSERRSVNAKARVARVDAATGAVTALRLPASGSGRGAAARIACPAADQCWLATYAGWLFHYGDGVPLPVDGDAAFRQLITFRPNESAAQFVPDAAPVDDSLALAPPPVEVQPPVTPPKTRIKRVAPVIRGVRRPRLQGRRGTTLVLRFRLTRKARVQLVARRRGVVVARTPNRLYAVGPVTLRLKLNRKRWPTGLKFVVRLPGQQPAAGGGDNSDTTVTTGPPAAAATP